MPLLISPIDGSPMHQIKRFGIELDVCPTSGGVWLDKGELEKLMALIREETGAAPAVAPPPGDYRGDQARDERRFDDDHRRDRRYRDDDDDDDRHDGRRGRRGSRLLDLFDF